MKKVLILANSSMGLFKFRNELMLELLKRYEVVISLPDDEFVSQLEEEGCRVVHTYINRRGMNPMQDLKTYSAYKKLLKAEKPGVVLTYTIKPNIYGGFLCRVKKIPYITTITGLGTSFEDGGIVQKLVTKMYRIALKKASCVAFQNETNMKIMKDLGCVGLNIRTIMVPGSGVNTDEHAYRDYPSGEEVHFLYIGRLMDDKGTSELLAAAAHTHERFPDVYFDIVGPYEEDSRDKYEPMIREAADSGAVIYHGYRTDVDNCYAFCNAYIHPSYHEGMSNVVLEAASCGRPVLTSDISGCREAYEDGVGGFLFEPKSSEAIETAIDRFLALPAERREQMGRDAREYVTEHFDRKIVINAYLDEIGRLIGQT